MNKTTGGREDADVFRRGNQVFRVKHILGSFIAQGMFDGSR